MIAIRQVFWAGALGLAAIACNGNDTLILNTGTVFFKVDAGTCSTGGSAIQFIIDGDIVGREAIAPGVLSKAYSTSAGPHSVSAKIVADGFTWPSMQVTVPAGGPYTAILVCP